MRTALYLGWFLSIGLAFYAGTTLPDLFSERIPPDQVSESEDQKRSERLLHLAQTPSSDVKPSVEAHVDTQVNSPSSDLRLEQVRQLLDNHDGIFSTRSIVKTYNAVLNLNLSEVERLLLQMTETEVSPAQNQGVVALLSRYAELAPLDALQFIDRHITNSMVRLSGTLSVIATWAQNEPFEALQWYHNSASVSEAMSPQERSMLLPTIFQSLAHYDINAAMTELARLDANQRQLSMAVGGMANVLDSSEQFESVYQFLSDNDMTEASHALFWRWAASESEGLSRWFENYHGDDRNVLAQSIYRAKYVNDFRQAADWYVSHVDREQLDEAIAHIVRSGNFMHPPGDILDWLKEQKHPNEQKYVVSLLKNAAFSDTDFAIQNISLVKSDEARKELSYSIYSALEHNNPELAQTFKNNSPFKREIEKFSEIRLSDE